MLYIFRFAWFWMYSNMRNVCAYLLKSLLVIGLFFGCTPKDESPAPTHKATSPTPAKPTPAKTPQEPFAIQLEGPSAPATLLNSMPKGYSALQAFGCIVLEFDKKPEDFKTQPPLEFCFANEVKRQFGEIDLQNLQGLMTSNDTVANLETTLYIRVPDVRPKKPEDTVWIFDASWGTTVPPTTVPLTKVPDASLHLVYVIDAKTEPSTSEKVYVKVPPDISLDVLAGIEVPPGPAILLSLIPKNHSVLDSFFVNGVVLIFNKKPKNFKTQPALEFCSVDEAKRYFGVAAQRTLKHLRMAEDAVTPFFSLGYAMYIKAPADRFPSSRPEDRYWVFEASWGEDPPRHAIRLLYIFSGLH